MHLWHQSSPSHVVMPSAFRAWSSRILGKRAVSTAYEIRNTGHFQRHQSRNGRCLCKIDLRMGNVQAERTRMTVLVAMA